MVIHPKHREGERDGLEEVEDSQLRDLECNLRSPSKLSFFPEDGDFTPCDDDKLLEARVLNVLSRYICKRTSCRQLKHRTLFQRTYRRSLLLKLNQGTLIRRTVFHYQFGAKEFWVARDNLSFVLKMVNRITVSI